MFCREAVADLRQVVAQNPDFPPILLVVQGSVSKSHEFFAERWPEARAIADPRRILYQAFGVRTGSPMQLVGPGVFINGARAAGKGFKQGQTVGDPLLMPALFAVVGDQIVWEYKFKNAGDHPDWARLPELAGINTAVQT